jgi:hypothetical protein
VYALVPMEGSLEELAEAEQAAREKARGMARREQAKYQEEVDGLLCLREATRRTLGKNLRKLGLRVR